MDKINRMDLLSLQPGSQIFSRNLPPRAAVQGVALVSWVFWDRGYFLRLLLFLLRFPSQPATREGLSALSPTLRTPCLLPLPPPASPPLFSPGGGRSWPPALQGRQDCAELPTALAGVPETAQLSGPN